MEWQPISTAPKDGSEFLGVDEKECITICWWEDGTWSDAYTTFYDGLPANPIMWMPLPSLPKVVK